MLERVHQIDRFERIDLLQSRRRVGVIRHRVAHGQCEFRGYLDRDCERVRRQRIARTGFDEQFVGERRGTGECLRIVHSQRTDRAAFGGQRDPLHNRPGGIFDQILRTQPLEAGAGLYVQLGRVRIENLVAQTGREAFLILETAEHVALIAQAAKRIELRG